MKSITAQDWELLSFFEIEPELLDPDAPWVYNDALYNVIFEQNLVSFAVQPSYRDVRLILSTNGKTVYDRKIGYKRTADRCSNWLDIAIAEWRSCESPNTSQNAP